jgi:hypothetical protein
VLIDRIGQLVMLLEGEDAVVDDLPVALFFSSLLAPSRSDPACQKLVRILRAWLMIFCCSKSLTKSTYQEAADITTRMPKVA